MESPARSNTTKSWRFISATTRKDGQLYYRTTTGKANDKKVAVSLSETSADVVCANYARARGPVDLEHVPELRVDNEPAHDELRVEAQPGHREALARDPQIRADNETTRLELPTQVKA